MAKVFRPILGKQNLGGRGTAESALSSQGVVGLREALNNFDNLVKHMNEVSGEILAEAIRPTFEKSLEYCPKDTEELVNSAFLQVERFRGNSVVAIGYGRGGKPDYTIYVHEMPFQHAEPTRSKFLQDAINEDLGKLPARVAAGLKQAAGT